MAGDEPLELKFRLHDGTDIGPNNYAPATTVATLKENILAQWPKGSVYCRTYELLSGAADALHAQSCSVVHIINLDGDKEINPKTINDMKLINAGRILENNKTLGESRISIGELPGGVITMHVVVRPPVTEKANEKELLVHPKKNGCACTIL